MSGKFLSKAILFSLVIGATAFSGRVSAANVYELAPVVVTATKTAESVEKVPASVSVVTAKDIEDHNYSSTAQLLMAVYLCVASALQIFLLWLTVSP